MKKNIFVTTGTQLPFDRMLGFIDRWAEKNQDSEITVQSKKAKNTYRHIEISEFLSPTEYKKLVEKSDIIIGHAGVGTIITAHEFNKPVIIIPRRFDLGEHRNNHQYSTAIKFKALDGVYVAESFEDICEILNKENLTSCSNKNNKNREKFIENLREVIFKQ